MDNNYNTVLLLNFPLPLVCIFSHLQTRITSPNLQKPLIFLIITQTWRGKYVKIHLPSVPSQAGSLFPMYPFIFRWGNQSDLCNHHTVTGKASKTLHKVSIVRDSREQIPGEGSRTCH